MGSQDRQKAIANGKIVETAAAVRRRRRAEASAMREELAIELYAQGKTNQEISDALFARYRVRLASEIPALVRRGLYRRSAANQASVAVAVELLDTYYRGFLEVYMPRALGQVRDPDTGQSSPPDLRAAEFALRVLDKWGAVHGAVAPPRAGETHLHLYQAPPDADAQRRAVMEALASEHSKQMEIEGALADTPAAAARSAPVHDGMIMPPIPAAPTQER